ncbi:hypothetical protein L6R50_25865, partial [Myxococcota bacterium]|nr:hypothetical protein [Myxococcota bacterium]
LWARDDDANWKVLARLAPDLLAQATRTAGGFLLDSTSARDEPDFWEEAAAGGRRWRWCAEYIEPHPLDGAYDDDPVAAYWLDPIDIPETEPRWPVRGYENRDGLVYDLLTPGEGGELCGTLDHDGDGYVVWENDCDDDPRNGLEDTPHGTSASIGGFWINPGVGDGPDWGTCDGVDNDCLFPADNCCPSQWLGDCPGISCNPEAEVSYFVVECGVAGPRRLPRDALTFAAMTLASAAAGAVARRKP